MTGEVDTLVHVIPPRDQWGSQARPVLPTGRALALLPGLVIASRHELVHDLLAGWRREPREVAELAQRDADFAAFTLRARTRRISVGGVGSCWHNRLLSSGPLIQRRRSARERQTDRLP